MLIYQMGKVGSTSLASFVPESHHIHSLYSNQPCPYFQRYTSHWLRRKISKYAAQPMRRIVYKSRSELKIISIVREPTARNISMFFQDLPFWLTGYVEEVDKETRVADIDWLWKVYRSVFNHEYAAQWFDKEIKRFTGIDVLNEGFDVDNGYGLYQKKNVQLLVFRLEDLESVKPVIERFTGRDIEINNLNDSKQKWYRGAYKEFVNAYKDDCRSLETSEYKKFRTVFGYECNT